ncbi:hypothetical protein HUB98_04085 [Paenibacillus barcinonensis]|nr:hypothetical protein HUB98_04085 [Paenibacillus barcinonensis]
MRLAKRFIQHIENEPILADFISKKKSKEFDIEVVLKEKHITSRFDIPTSINDEITFIFQLLKYATINFDRYDTLTRSYAFYKGATASDSIREFNREVVKLLVNHLTDYLGERAIELGIDEKPNAKILVQGNVGQLNFSESGNVTANQVNQNTSDNLIATAKELLQLLKDTDISNIDIKEDALDFIEEVQEEVQEGKPLKPSLFRRVQNSLSNVRGLIEEGSLLTVTIDKFMEALNQFQV